MKCRKVRRKLVSFLDGDLAASEAEAVRRHIEACKACQKEAELLNSTLSLALGSSCEKPAPHPPENFVSAFWQRVEGERAAAVGEARQASAGRVRRPLVSVMTVRYAIAVVAAVVVVAAALFFAVLRRGETPHDKSLTGVREEVKQEKAAPSREDELARIEERLKELETAVRSLRMPEQNTAGFTAGEMREIYASITLAAANNYRDILNMNEEAAKRYAQVASLYPETSAGQEAQKILSRLN